MTKALSKIYQYKTIENRKIRFALVGCGRIAYKHFEAISNHENDCELIAVCDSDKNKLKKAIKATNVPGYISLDEMLDNTKADIIILASPSGLHPSQTIKIAQRNTHVMTEKPMATRWDEALAMINCCDKANVRLFVVKQNRHNATLRLLKKTITTGRFGNIYMVNINVFWNREQSYYDSDSWRGTVKLDGGALLNQASHYVDLLDWLIGPIESVQAYTETLSRNIEVEDCAVLSVRWKSGAIGSINATTLTFPKNLEGSITIIGEKGTVKLGGVAVNEIQHWEFSQPHSDDDQVNEVSYKTTSVYGFGHSAFYQNVIQTLRGKSEAETDGREGLRSIEIIMAAYQSACKGQRITLPLKQTI